MVGPTADDVLPYLKLMEAAYSKVESSATSYDENLSLRPPPDFGIERRNVTQTLMGNIVRQFQRGNNEYPTSLSRRPQR